MRIAFQGERGAYSEAAARELFGAGIQSVPCPRFRDVFEAVERGEADAGVIPIENSHTGPITDNHDLLRNSPLHVVAEHPLRIRHCLLALPGVTLSQVKRAYSHVQALMQCEAFLQRHGIEAVTEADTAGSARRISQERPLDAAAIASAHAAEVYGLAVLAEGIETSATNHTRFLALSRQPAPRALRAKTSLLLTLNNVPGALHTALGAFASRGLNLTRLESRPSRERPWEYLFYVDVEGHAEDRPLVEALAELRVTSVSVREFGSYPQSAAG